MSNPIREQDEISKPQHKQDVEQALKAHYKFVLEGFLNGRLIPFLGAGVNLYGKDSDRKWMPENSEFLPSGSELAQYFADKYEYPPRQVQVYCPVCQFGQNPGSKSGCPCCKDSVVFEKPHDLTRISQYIALNGGMQVVYDSVRQILAREYTPTPLHEFFATIPALLRNRNCPHPYQLLVTTNYDNMLERAFIKQNESYDLLYYIADGADSGNFMLVSNGKTHLIDKPNKYSLPLNERSVILKIHGAIDHDNAEKDSYVITEDHYIDYLARKDIMRLLPVTLMEKMKRSHFLFLGYGLRDWNLRVIFKRIWKGRKLGTKSWAIQKDSEPLEALAWKYHNVDILEVELERYLADLKKSFEEM